MNPIEGYASANSIAQGQTLDLHLNAEPQHSTLKLEVSRLGSVEQLVLNDTVTVTFCDTPEDAYETGCNWLSAYTLTIPKGWQSGVYRAKLISDENADIYTEILFVVKAATPGVTSKILFQLAGNTYQAYNGWGGKSLYGYNSDNKPATRISFNRPDRYDDFYNWELPFIQWMETKGFSAEYCTNVDLHADPNLLSHYQLLLSVGHDEYWSWEMRDQVEAFVEQGGNVAFFGGNLCWWQVRFEDNNRTMICHKNANSDPIKSVDPNRVTVNWKDAIVNRPENQLTGVSFTNGAEWDDSAGARPNVGYQVRFKQHWAFSNTGLENGDEFGAEVPILGYETDAAKIHDRNGVLMATGEDGTPINFVILATADLSDWKTKSGMATMGLYQNTGTVFTAGTIDWARGLLQPTPVVSQITENILRELSQRRELFPEIENRDFNDWVAETHPQVWEPEGSGKVQLDETVKHDDQPSLLIDATEGLTWVSQGPFECQRERYYLVSAWVLANQPGAMITLQSMTTWKDFVVAEHSGSGEWEHVAAYGTLFDDAPTSPVRLKLEAAPGVVAHFAQISAEIL
jgi:hypothetical protein